jgi:hypothetical protein
MTRVIVYHERTVISGVVIEQTIYECALFHGLKLSPRQLEKRKFANFNNSFDLTQQELLEKKLESRKLSMRRSKKTLTRLIDSNVNQYTNTLGRVYPPVFLTLTFKKDIRNQKDANELYSLFIKRLNYKVNGRKSNTLKYSVVVEFQDKTRGGVIHYHVLLYDFPYIDSSVLENIWGEGTINIKKVKHVKNIGRYVTKYMSKDFQDPRLDGHKRYFSSRGLIKPKIYIGIEAYNIIRRAIPKDTPKKENSFVSEKLGEIYTTTFTLNGSVGLKELLGIEGVKQIQDYDIS